MTPLRLAFLALAIWGAVHPMYWFLRHMRETGTGLGGLIDAWSASGYRCTFSCARGVH